MSLSLISCIGLEEDSLLIWDCCLVEYTCLVGAWMAGDSCLIGDICLDGDNCLDGDRCLVGDSCLVGDGCLFGERYLGGETCLEGESSCLAAYLPGGDLAWDVAREDGQAGLLIDDFLSLLTTSPLLGMLAVLLVFSAPWYLKP